MNRHELIILIPILMVISLPIVFGGFWSLGKVFEALRLQNAKEWEILGRPIFGIPLMINLSEAKLPKNMALLQFKWLFHSPAWVKESDEIKKYFLLFRIFGILSFVPALGVIYAVISIFKYGQI